MALICTSYYTLCSGSQTFPVRGTDFGNHWLIRDLVLTLVKVLNEYMCVSLFTTFNQNIIFWASWVFTWNWLVPRPSLFCPNSWSTGYNMSCCSWDLAKFLPNKELPQKVAHHKSVQQCDTKKMLRVFFQSEVKFTPILHPASLFWWLSEKLIKINKWRHDPY